MAVARLFNLPELELICSNAKEDNEFLNPSIGTWLNDRNCVIAKKLFLNKPLMSDVVLVVEGRSVFCHKIVLATRCEVLGAMLTGGFAESSRQQVKKGFEYLIKGDLYHFCTLSAEVCDLGSVCMS